METIELDGRRIRVTLRDDLGLAVFGKDGRPLWSSSRERLPELWARSNRCYHALPLSAAGEVAVDRYADGSYRGYRLRLSQYSNVDVCLELSIAIDAECDDLLIQIEQTDGMDTVSAVRDMYCFEKPTSDGGYMILPHGSGYLIPADCPDELWGQREPGGFIGARWTLPMFGMVRGNEALCAIVDTWWDCDVTIKHAPGDHSAFSFNWEPSLGELGYARRLLLCFADGMDYVGMAKRYREHARWQSLVRTLEEKAQDTPIIRKYADNILYRWTAWDPNDTSGPMADIRRLRDEGFGINFFYPKWPNGGYADDGTPVSEEGALWQAYLHPNPVPGGWPALVSLEREVHELECVIQGFVCPISQDDKALDYSEDRWPVSSTGEQMGYPISARNALDRTKRVLNALEAADLKFDVLYFDGYAAHLDLPQDFAALHTMTRRQNFEAQMACFSETRRRGIMPGAELSRFWAIGECDYFFFTDWSGDRLSSTPHRHSESPAGEPIPIFQLVFHDCFMAGFSGGGYVAYADGFDWWDQRTPRLYELMYAAAPSYNWLPDPRVPITNWASEQQQNKRAWLKQWNAFYRAIAMSDMVSHQFLSDDRSRQRTEFANGVAAEFNMAENGFRVDCLAGFSGDWQTPPDL